MVARPRRSVLYMPGSNAKAMAKARDAAGRRASSSTSRIRSRPTPRSRRARRSWRRSKGGFGGREVVIRVNGPHTPWGDGRP